MPLSVSETRIASLTRRWTIDLVVAGIAAAGTAAAAAGWMDHLVPRVLPIERVEIAAALPKPARSDTDVWRAMRRLDLASGLNRHLAAAPMEELLPAAVPADIPAEMHEILSAHAASTTEPIVLATAPPLEIEARNAAAPARQAFAAPAPPLKQESAPPRALARTAPARDVVVARSHEKKRITQVAVAKVEEERGEEPPREKPRRAVRPRRSQGETVVVPVPNSNATLDGVEAEIRSRLAGPRLYEEYARRTPPQPPSKSAAYGAPAESRNGGAAEQTQKRSSNEEAHSDPPFEFRALGLARE